MGRQSRYQSAAAIALLLLASVSAAQQTATPLAGRVDFSATRNPPPWIEVHAAARRDFDLGQSIFKSEWAPAGTATGPANVGLGPLFVEKSCNACHEDAARGRPAPAADALPPSFVMQLGGPFTDYGHVLSTRGVDGHAAEARITVTMHQRRGRYADGERWTLSEPRYAIVEPAFGPLPAGTIFRPRIAPALFGVGLLDAVPQPALDSLRNTQPRRLRGAAGGRFGWQGDATSLVDQTAIAFAREMGLTSDLQPRDDCTAAQHACRDAPQAGIPELPERLFHAVNTFQFLIAAPARGPISPAADAAGERLFARVGCADCHVPDLPVPRDSGSVRIDPRTDLLLHDMGTGLADRDAAGRPVKSLWRTPPLWGLAYALQAGPVALLHDGRAGNIEEAILWHDGQAGAARRHFMSLDAATRRQLVDWIATL